MNLDQYLNTSGIFKPIPSKPDNILMKEYGTTFLHRLNNNENTLGPPPLAFKIISGFQSSSAAISFRRFL